MDRSPLKVGVLALQGDVAEHLAALRRCGAEAIEVRTGDDLEDLDALVLPGGESTTMLKLIDRFDLREGLVKRIGDGLPAFGTCAGAILLARVASNGEPTLGLLDLEVVRNAYGRQVDSFEADVEVAGVGQVRAVFIRAPVFESAGPEVEVLATWGDRPVLVRADHVLASSFHPELTEDLSLHRYFLSLVAGGG